ncbi:MAG: FAD-binding oxidoreductase [Rhodobacteraceae bacterium]|nr:FAD-binding oxidoreductase [Paracoccaceae bacterium]
MKIKELRSRLRGELITSDDPGLERAHEALIWNGRKPGRQARLIVRAACVEDVQEAVRFAAESGLTVSPRGGGHQFTGIAAKADMVIDLGALDGLKIDVAARSARIEPAVTNERMATVLARHDLAFPLGHCGSVPMSGYLLGGGVGWNSGAWGIACFSVMAVEVVLADGRLVTAAADENPEIFWAARGAGPRFFGIVTAYHVRLHQAPRAILTSVRVYPLDAVDQVAAWAEQAMARAPANIEFTTKISAAPPQMPVGGMILQAIATVFASGEAEARALLAALAEGAPEGTLHRLDDVPTPFDVLYELTAKSMPEGRRYAVDSVWSDATYPEVLGEVVRAMTQAPSPESIALVMLRSPMARNVEDAAFSQIGRIFGAVYGIWQDPVADRPMIDWLRTTMDTIAPLGLGTYAGESDLDRGPRRLKIHSAAAAARIDELASRFDPEGLFGGPGARARAA